MIIFRFFSLKSIFCIMFVASLLLILVVMPWWSALLMFKIAISLRLIDIINISWKPFRTIGCNLNPISKKYQQWEISLLFHAIVLLISIPSETLVLYHIAFIIYTKTYILSLVLGNWYNFFLREFIIVVVISIFVKTWLNEYYNMTQNQNQ